MKIVETIGGMTVDEMLSRISSKEISKWAVEFKIRHDEMEKDQARAKALASAKRNYRR